MAVIRMTRAEYEKKYGQKAPSSVSSQETQSVSSLSKPSGKGFASRIKSDITNRGENVYNAITGSEEFSGQTPIRRGVSAAGELTGAPVNVAYQALPEVARTGLKKTGEAIGGVFNLLSDKISDSKALQGWVTKNPKAAKALEEIAGTTAGLGKISGDVLTMNAGAKALQGAANVGTKAVQKVGQGVKTVGEKTYKSAYDLTKNEAQMVQNNKIKVDFAKKELSKLPKNSPEYAAKVEEISKLQSTKPTVRPDTALEKGLAGTEKQIGRQAGVEKMDLWKNKLEPALKNSKEVITKDELFAKARARVAAEVDPTRKAAFQRALESLEDDFKGVKDYDLVKANELKSSIAKFTPSKIFKGQEVASQMKTLQADMAGAIREKIYKSLPDINARKAFIDYGNLKQLEDIGIKALTQGGTKGGFGSFWSTIKDQATIPVKTVGGKVLYRVGDKLEFLGDKGVKTLGQHFNNIGVKIVPAPKVGSVEQSLESATGWQPGMKKVFDTALLKGDKATIQKMLPKVPVEYKTRFADKIQKIIGDQ